MCIFDYPNVFKWEVAEGYMKKMLTLMILGLFVVSMIGAVSAETFIVGKIYESDFVTPLGDANITVTCEGNVQETISASDGTYDVEYSVANCSEGEVVTVVAQKGDLFGSDTGVVSELKADIKFAVINVTVPEFGFFIGIATLLLSVGVLYVVRKE